MSRPKPLTDAQVEALEWIAKRTSVSTGPRPHALQGHSGSAIQALVRRGYVTAEFFAVTSTTFYSVTETGKAVVAARALERVCPYCGAGKSRFHTTCNQGDCLEAAAKGPSF